MNDAFVKVSVDDIALLDADTVSDTLVKEIVKLVNEALSDTCHSNV